jgi:hypothetical protein
MRPWSSRLFGFVRSALGVGIVIWLVHGIVTRAGSLAELQWSASLPEVVVATGASVLALGGLVALFIALLAATRLHRGAPLAAYARLWLQPYLFRYVPGKVMLLAERVRLGRGVGIPAVTSVSLVVWEMVLYLGGAALVGAVGVLCVGPAMALPASPAVLGPLAGAASIGAVAFVPMLATVARKAPVLARRLGPSVLGVPAAVQVVLVAGYGLIWLLFGTSFAATCRWFEGGEAAGAGTALWFVVAYVAGIVIGVTPAGIGVREGILIEGLARQIPYDGAVAAAVASRTLMTVVELVLVGLAVVLSRAVPEDCPDV